MDGWETIYFHFGANDLFFRAFAVSFREGNLSVASRLVKDLPQTFRVVDRAIDTGPEESGGCAQRVVTQFVKGDMCLVNKDMVYVCIDTDKTYVLPATPREHSLGS